MVKSLRYDINKLGSIRRCVGLIEILNTKEQLAGTRNLDGTGCGFSQKQQKGAYTLLYLMLYLCYLYI